jgi:hypothetical protein
MCDTSLLLFIPETSRLTLFSPAKHLLLRNHSIMLLATCTMLLLLLLLLLCIMQLF